MPEEDPASTPTPVLIMVMGVAGTGKTTLAHALCAARGLPFVEGDEMHPPANIAKMSAGQPLSDADREPWLALLRATAERLVAQQQQQQQQHAALAPAPGADAGADAAPHRAGAVVTCSALRRYYRDILRGAHAPAAPALPTCFVFIRGTRALLLERVAARQGHYMKANMVDSQLETLESPEGEHGVVVVNMEDPTEVQLQQALAGLDAFVGGL